MIPGMNPRKVQQMMKKMGIAQVELDATEVIIKCVDKEIVIQNPQVSKVNMMGQQTYQVVGEETVREIDNSPEISEDDIKTVIDQTGVSETVARESIENNDYDLAQAIMSLKSDDE